MVGRNHALARPTLVALFTATLLLLAGSAAHANTWADDGVALPTNDQLIADFAGVINQGVNAGMTVAEVIAENGGAAQVVWSNNACTGFGYCAGTGVDGVVGDDGSHFVSVGEWSLFRQMCVGGRVWNAGHSDYLHASNPDHEMCDPNSDYYGGPDDEPIVCVWTYLEELGWHPGSSGEYWWGTRTYREDNCGNFEFVSNDRVCTASDCVAEAALDARENIYYGQLHQMYPEIETSPEDRSPVNIAAWFWHEEWETLYATGRYSHETPPPTTVVMTAQPTATTWRFGETEGGHQVQEVCSGEPEPFAPDYSLNEPYDPDGCNSHRYRRPSLGTGPDGEDVHRVSAAISYDVGCIVHYTLGSYTYPLACSQGLMGVRFSTMYEVYELQAVFR